MTPTKAPSRRRARAGARTAVVLAAGSLALVLTLWRPLPKDTPATPDPVTSQLGPPPSRGAPSTPRLPDVLLDLPPLPGTGQAPPRSPGAIRAVYEFAARHPEVLEYIPCFCGCERNGHRSNHDCFVAGRDARGKVTWDAHGLG